MYEGLQQIRLLRATAQKCALIRIFAIVQVCAIVSPHLSDRPPAPDLPPARGSSPGQRVGEPRGGTEAETGRRLLPLEAEHPAAVRQLEEEGGGQAARGARKDLQHRQPAHPHRDPPMTAGQLFPGDHHAC